MVVYASKSYIIRTEQEAKTFLENLHTQEQISKDTTEPQSIHLGHQVEDQ